MSCVITFRLNGTIYMGCDAACTFHPEGTVNILRSPRKVMSIKAANGRYALVGASGALDYLCLIHEELAGLEMERPTFGAVRGHIDRAFEKDPDLWTKFDAGRDPGTILIVIPGETEDALYRITNKHTWVQLEDGIHAVGSGADLAMGALHALIANSPDNAVADGSVVADWLTIALEAAETYDVHVQRPFYLTSTRKLSDEEK